MKTETLEDITKRLYNENKYVEDSIKKITLGKFYDDLFLDKRHKIKKVLEIGINKGDALKLWREYFPNAEIYGIDVNPCDIEQGKRIHTMVADESRVDQLKKVIDEFGENFDIIIDDADHWVHEEHIAFGYFFKYLKPGGAYVFESLGWSKYIPSQIIIHISEREFCNNIANIKEAPNRFKDLLRSMKKGINLNIGRHGVMPGCNTYSMLNSYIYQGELRSAFISDRILIDINKQIKEVRIYPVGQNVLELSNNSTSIGVVLKK